MPTVLITGANRGLGLELARQYAADGWQVIATCRDPDAAHALHSLSGTRIDQVIAGLTPEQSGSFLRYDGATVPW